MPRVIQKVRGVLNRRRLIGLAFAAVAIYIICVISALATGIYASAPVVARIELLGGKAVYGKRPTLRISTVFLPEELCNWISPPITEVVLNQTAATDDDVMALIPLRHLSRLGLFEAAISDKSLTSIARMPNLKFLWLDNTAVTGVGIHRLSGLRHLTDLLLQGTRIDDQSLKEVGKLSTLRSLALGSTAITDNGVDHLAYLSLEELKLDNTLITDRSAISLANFLHLSRLDLFDTQITDKFFEQSHSWPQLVVMRIHNTHITDASVPYLANLASLKLLSVGGTKITDKGAADLQKALPKCRIYR